MAQQHYHRPVMAREIVELFADLPAGVIVDATVGGGGHAWELLSRSNAHRVLGIDRDPEAREAARERLNEFADRARVVDGTFGELVHVVRENRDFVGESPVIGVLMDLGVSSHQLDDAGRGFSFRSDAPLDMRMDPTRGETAAQLLARVDEHTLARLLRQNGETRFAGAIARSVLARQPKTTMELVEAVERAVPAAARRRGHVATRVFQALRVAVNDEVEQLSEGLAAALETLDVGGIIAVISYHSGEDRAVKAFFALEQSGGCTCPPDLPCVCGAVSRVQVLKASARLASAEEIAENPRSRSARLRVARKVAP